MKAWLGFGNYIESVRQSIEGFEGMMKGLHSSEPGGGVMPGVKVSDITFVGVPVRVYEPPAGGEGHLRRGLMFFHGGGWAFGSASEYKCSFVVFFTRKCLYSTGANSAPNASNTMCILFLCIVFALSPVFIL